MQIRKVQPLLPHYCALNRLGARNWPINVHHHEGYAQNLVNNYQNRRYRRAVTSNVTELIGVYDADSTLLGEMSYWIKARFGKSHCSLCDLTHGIFRKKGEWVTCEQTLGIPILTYHRNDAPEDVLAVTQEFPILLARTRNRLEVALTREGLDQFSGDTERFATWLRNFISE